MPSAEPEPVEQQPEVPRTELEELQYKAHQVTDDVSINNQCQNNDSDD